MSLEKEIKTYEILVRFNENGKVGASAQTLTVMRDGDLIIGSTINPLEALTHEQLQELVSAIGADDWYVPEPDVAE